MRGTKLEENDSNIKIMDNILPYPGTDYKIYGK